MVASGASSGARGAVSSGLSNPARSSDAALQRHADEAVRSYEMVLSYRRESSAASEGLARATAALRGRLETAAPAAKQRRKQELWDRLLAKMTRSKLSSLEILEHEWVACRVHATVGEGGSRL